MYQGIKRILGYIKNPTDVRKVNRMATDQRSRQLQEERGELEAPEGPRLQRVELHAVVLPDRPRGQRGVREDLLGVLVVGVLLQRIA